MTTTGALTSDPDGGTTVVLTRRFPAPVEDVWASITESDRLARWFGTWTGDPADGSVMVTMNAEGEAVPASCYAIDVCEPPHRLVVRTVDDTGSWTLSAELSEDDGTTTLVFAQHGIELVRVVQGDYSYESGHEAAATLTGWDSPDAVFCTSDAMAMGILDVCRADFPHNRPRKFRLYGFDNLSLTDFDAYPIASIGYDKAAYVEHIVQFLIEPAAFKPGQDPIRVPTRFVPRLTA